MVLDTAYFRYHFKLLTRTDKLLYLITSSVLRHEKRIEKYFFCVLDMIKLRYHFVLSTRTDRKTTLIYYNHKEYYF